MFEQVLQMLKDAGVKDDQLGLVIGLGLFVILVPVLLAVKAILGRPAAPPPPDADPAHRFDMGVAPPESVTPVDDKPLPDDPAAQRLPVTVQLSETVMMPRLKEKKVIARTKQNVTHFAMKSDVFFRVQELSRGGAALDEMCRAVNGEYTDWDNTTKRDFEEMVKYMLKMKPPGTGAAVSVSFTSSPGQKDISFVSVQNDPVENTYKIDPEMLARARTMLGAGASVEEICQAVIADYEGLSGPVRLAYQEALLTLLDIEGKSG
ncbi:MAG: hypothetical protein ACAH83_15665 [Alphaproteobacteria bacterium]